MYDYQKQRPFVFSDEGQRMFLKVRDEANRLCDLAGACTVEKVLNRIGGDSWNQLACVDRLVELSEFIHVQESNVATQHTILRRKA